MHEMEGRFDLKLKPKKSDGKFVHAWIQGRNLPGLPDPNEKFELQLQAFKLELVSSLLPILPVQALSPQPAL